MGQKKTFVLDTNVLVHDPEAILSFEENDVVLPLELIEELDGLKRGKGEYSASVRQALRLIDSFREQGIISKGVRLPGGGWLKVIESGKTHGDLDNTSDNRIISVALRLVQDLENPVILVSKDTAVRIKAETLGLASQDYQKDKTTIFTRYGKVLDTDAEHCNGIHSLRFITVDGKVFALSGSGEERVPVRNRTVFGISAKNIEQQCALWALTQEEVLVVALTGKAGTGKTLLALAAGLELTPEKQRFEQILIARPVVPMGNDLGFLPGQIEEKLEPWMQPVHDNLDILVKTPFDDKQQPRQAGGRSQKRYKNPDYLMDTGVIKMEALTYIRGRSLPKRFIIIDEAQNLRPFDVKTIITRCGEGTKIIFTGDLSQIDNPYLDAQSNGLAYLISRLIDQPWFCYLNLQMSVRSPLAEAAAMLL